ncbi:hypothetical protein SBRCBS47491_005372 [Sporothrix bragantina]|uniref:WLM domain-containing protein n=1 Tax=Sporothrix bragantina TaxID=671064 RepID=A0ABP0BWG8_9PEZI
MPVGIQRLNARRSQPNPHIVFIKPLKGPDEDIARQFLERIAAQCVPIMREHHLSVMTLEEYEPNREFVGRNFNAGEVIQLVLKAQGAGHRWLPFQYVQMVMMHELAHCRQMNHSRAFWAVRDAYAAQMRRLWADRYTGEGIWGRGAKLGAAADGGPPLYERNVALPGDDPNDGVLLEHLCGGTYQSRNGRRKRKAKPVLTYREREDRRIRRKFGVNGVALGDDLDERAKLDVATTSKASGSSSGGKQTTLSGSSTLGIQKGKAAGPLAGTTKTEQKRLATKPRVAKSKRGRDLRAAAALARFEQNQAETAKEEASIKDEIAEIKHEEEDVIDLETDSDIETDDVEFEYEDAPEQPALVGPDAIDIDGTALLDGSGGSMVRVCEGEDTEDSSDAKRELRELLQTSIWGVKSEKQKERQNDKQKGKESGKPRPAIKQTPPASTKASSASASTSRTKPTDRPLPAATPIPDRTPKREPVKDEQREVFLSQIPHAPQIPLDGTCPICSFANDPRSITCAVCSHVLQADAVPGAWHCHSAACRASEGVQFLNAGDCGVCGVCGQRKGQT